MPIDSSTQKKPRLKLAGISLAGLAVIVAIAEYDGAITNPNGLDPEAVAAHRRDRGST